MFCPFHFQTKAKLERLTESEKAIQQGIEQFGSLLAGDTNTQEPPSLDSLVSSNDLVSTPVSLLRQLQVDLRCIGTFQSFSHRFDQNTKQAQQIHMFCLFAFRWGVTLLVQWVDLALIAAVTLSKKKIHFLGRTESRIPLEATIPSKAVSRFLFRVGFFLPQYNTNEKLHNDLNVSC